MNRIFGDRIGVDGKTHNMDEICRYLVNKTETTISGNLNNMLSSNMLSRLGQTDKEAVKYIIKKLHNILIADVPNLKNYADYFDKKYPELFYKKQNGHWRSTKLGTSLLQAFNYSKFRETVLVDIAKMLNVKTCPYCNMHYTLYANEKVKSIRKVKTLGLTRFQFDHFYDKLHYPMLSMSFYNLIPSCAVCNQGKSAKALSLSYHPYHSDIHKLFHFEVADPLGPYTAARMNDEVEVALMPELGVNKDEFEEYIGTFHLTSLYGRHGDVIQEVFDKAYVMPYYLNPANFNFLSNNDKDYLKRLWMGNYTKPEEIEKRPMAKFIQDIWRQAKGEI